MDAEFTKHVNSYVSFLKTQFNDEVIPKATERALTEVSMNNLREELKTPKQLQDVLNNVAGFANALYSTGKPEYGLAARDYSIMLVKELTRMKSNKNVLEVLKLVGEHDQEGYKICLTYAAPELAKIERKARFIVRELRGAVSGIVIGVVVSACIWAIRLLLKY